MSRLFSPSAIKVWRVAMLIVILGSVWGLVIALSIEFGWDKYKPSYESCWHLGKGGGGYSASECPESPAP